MDRKPDDGGTSDFETPSFDLESQWLDFENYEFNTTAEDTDSSVFDCSLDESFQQIKNDLKRLHRSTPKKTSFYHAPVAASLDEPPAVVVDDEFPEIDIDQRFDVMKDRLSNYRAQETERLRRCIIQLNNTISSVTDNEGKNVCVRPNKKLHLNVVVRYHVNWQCDYNISIEISLLYIRRFFFFKELK